jgi:hypothetical protein
LTGDNELPEVRDAAAVALATFEGSFSDPDSAFFVDARDIEVNECETVVE